MRVSLESSSLVQGQPARIRVSDAPVADYCQLQVDVFQVGVTNPGFKMGTGTTPNMLDDGIAAVNLDTSSLTPGLYELMLVRLHSPVDATAATHLDFVSGHEFERAIFEVRESQAAPRTSADVLAELLNIERSLNETFVAEHDVRTNRGVAGERFGALVFVKDVLVGVRMRFAHFEMVPTGGGLDSEDAVRFVNDFLAQNTPTGVSFPYDDATRTTSRRTNPVFVVHFPSLLADLSEQARDYCISTVNRLLLALALSRDAGGVVFEVVIISQTTRQAMKYAIVAPYVGNLLLGSMSGENFEQVGAYLSGIQADPMNEFLVGMFREARREHNPDFQYVRYWQILETMADNQNYDPAVPLLDFEGNPMMDGTRERKLSGSVNSVFNLLRENEIGDSVSNWASVNVWFAFRNAVAHHGAVARYTELSRESVREWGRIGFVQREENPGIDPHLWRLKEDAKLLLMRRLVASQTTATSPTAATAVG